MLSLVCLFHFLLFVTLFAQFGFGAKRTNTGTVDSLEVTRKRRDQMTEAPATPFPVQPCLAVAIILILVSALIAYFVIESSSDGASTVTETHSREPAEDNGEYCTGGAIARSHRRRKRVGKVDFDRWRRRGND
ncbi:uncharacterized protein LOC144139055 [Haemaphysalis longicornis]